MHNFHHLNGDDMLIIFLNLIFDLLFSLHFMIEQVKNYWDGDFISIWDIFMKGIPSLSHLNEPYSPHHFRSLFYWVAEKKEGSL